MIIYSASAGQSLTANPGERVVYGKNEHDLHGFGVVKFGPNGQLMVNDHPLNTLNLKYEWVRKM
jgi:hypothetical protein